MCQAGLTACGSVCRDLQTDNSNCGACGRTCPSGNVCVSGSCSLTCASGFANCSGVCRDLQTDNNNCGACARACSSGQVCLSGTCTISCPAGQSACGSSCFDLTSDRNHCGTCTTVCPSGQVCASSTCVTSCTAGLTACGTSCVDLTSDRTHCGTCTTVCPTGQSCVSGACTLVCPSGQSNCSGTCRDLASDNNNCGACGTVCPAGQVCSSRSCVVTCAASLTNCSGSCVNVNTDPANCGACGRVCASVPNAAPTCGAGVCSFACTPGFGNCNGASSDGCEVSTATSVTNCGTCGTTCTVANGVPACVSGACRIASCNTGFADCNGTLSDGCEVNLQTSASNCGACGMACSGSASCSAGICSGFSGETGTSWTLAPGGTAVRGVMSWAAPGTPFLYAGNNSSFARYSLSTGTWSSLAGPSVGLPSWGSPALVGADVWEIAIPSVVRYTVATNSWTTIRSDLRGSNDHSQTAVDRDGNLWSYNAGELVRYNPTTNTVTYFPTTLGGQFETRLVYDGTTNSIYFGGFGGRNLYRFDLGTMAVTSMTPKPVNMLSDVFCSDRSGHIYSGGCGGGAEVYQYNTTTNTWRRIPDFTTPWGCNGSCAVLGDGFLYAYEDGGSMYRIPLL
ncbi:MAG: MXAN_6577-like cysteine-rich protein [Polyangiales bacterium]